MVALRPIPMLGAKKATDSTARALRRPVKVKPLAGYIGLEKRKPFAPPFVKWMYVRAHWSGKPRCYDAKEQEICEDDFFFIFAKEVVVTLTSLSVDEVLINTHATCMPIWAAGRFRLRAAAPEQRAARLWLIAICDARLHRFAFDFFRFALFRSAFRSCVAVPRIRFANCDAKPDKLLPDLCISTDPSGSTAL